MSEIVIAGNTSGSVTIAAPDVAGTTTLTLPATSGSLVTEAGIPAQLGQTWTDVKASRTRSVTYTNTTGAAILVNITAQNINGVVMFLIIDGVQAARAYGYGTTMEVRVSGIVPNGSSYYMINSASGTILLWSELR